jgi:hypothetical protein
MKPGDPERGSPIGPPIPACPTRSSPAATDGPRRGGPPRGGLSLLDLAADPFQARYERRALDALGYEVVENRSLLRL